jgi:hypothetical protein
VLNGAPESAHAAAIAAVASKPNAHKLIADLYIYDQNFNGCFLFSPIIGNSTFISSEFIGVDE